MNIENINYDSITGPERDSYQDTRWCIQYTDGIAYLPVKLTSGGSHEIEIIDINRKDG